RGVRRDYGTAGDVSVSFAKRVAHLRPEGAYEVLALAQSLERAGRDIIHLELGEPDFRASGAVTAAGVEAIHAGRTRYNPPPGIHELRAALAEDAGRRRGIDVRPEQVVVSPGAKPNLLFPTLALVEPGDEGSSPNPASRPTGPRIPGAAAGRVPDRAGRLGASRWNL